MPSPTPTSLERRLGPFDAAAIVVANVIGAGILFTPPFIASMVPHPVWFLSTWLAGGVLAFFGAMAYAELAALRPRAGGEYVICARLGTLPGHTGVPGCRGVAGAMRRVRLLIVSSIDIPGVDDRHIFGILSRSTMRSRAP